MDVEELKRKYGNLAREHKDFINLNPLQTAGKLTQAAEKALVEFGDGYSVCDYCNGQLDRIKNPPVFEFIHKDLPGFLGCDVARVTHGAREGKFMVMHALAKPGDVIIVDRNRHYSTDVVAERVGLKIVKVPNSGDPERLIKVEDYIPLIEKHKPALILLTYPDGELGNLPDAKRLGEIAKEHGVPYLLNAAYAVGRMPVNMNGIGADFVVGSGHKSMAASGPIGVLGMRKEWTGKILQESPDHPGKEIECLGCTVRGAPLITLMASFPYVVERVRHWDEEVKKARWFSEQLEVLGLVQVGEKPHNHDLMKFETEIFYEISKFHPKKRAFLYEELKDNGIRGLKQGRTKSMKISTYGTPKADLKKVIDVFEGIVDSY
jgi:Sep-tRNA:Cys-tRNA synthetase